MNLSIVVPVYNGEKHITKCLESVVNGMLSNMEIIIVNDGSKDSTEKIVKDFIAEHKKCNMKIITIENAGVSHARYVGMMESSGIYVGFIDSDDWVEISYYSELLNYAIENDADIVCGGYILDYINYKENVNHCVDNCILTSEEGMRHLHERTAIFPFMWNKIYKKNILEKVTFPNENVIGEDYMAVQQAIQLSKKIYIVNNHGYHYIQVDGSMSKGGYTKAHQVAYNKYKIILSDLESKYPTLKSSIYNYMNAEFIFIIAAMVKNSVYDRSIIEEITTTTRRNIINFLSDKNISIFTKSNAALLCVNYKLLRITYKIRSWKRKML